MNRREKRVRNVRTFTMNKSLLNQNVLQPHSTGGCLGRAKRSSERQKEDKKCLTWSEKKCPFGSLDVKMWSFSANSPTGKIWSFLQLKAQWVKHLKGIYTLGSISRTIFLYPLKAGSRADPSLFTVFWGVFCFFFSHMHQVVFFMAQHTELEWYNGGCASKGMLMVPFLR